MKESIASVHEASHALVAHKLGQKVLNISIEDDEKSKIRKGIYVKYKRII